MKFQNETSNTNSHGGVRKLPYVFTEQGVAMSATVLKTKNASSVSIKIMRTFVAMRHFVSENRDIFKRLTTVEYKMLEYDENFEKIL